MACKYYRHEFRGRTLIGADDSTEDLNICILKQTNEEKQMEIFRALAEKGLESNAMTDECPLAEENNFEECPFYKNSA